ncbi:Ig-like domain-containing protein [Reinekea sp. G2M2-21]|uniref:golvesin C-terminal-like domain-containing protein n=1 Tax=Reinekea sp. G2M2-21 TaxID=2788942 RepID=UPI0018AA601D|nr:Ig-like domain-containing protein [Reinekea sp. G2M2-21]
MFLDTTTPRIAWKSSLSATNSHLYTADISIDLNTQAERQIVIVDNDTAVFEGSWSLVPTQDGSNGGDYSKSEPIQLSGEYVVESAEATLTGSWIESTTIPGYVGANYLYSAANPSPLANQITWPISNITGIKSLSVNFTSDASRTQNAVYRVQHVAGTTEVVVNQKMGGGEWYRLGEFELDENSSVTLLGSADGYTIADAILVGDDTTPYSKASYTIDAPKTARYRVEAQYVAASNHNQKSIYEVYWSDTTGLNKSLTSEVDQRKNGSIWHPLGYVDLIVGQSVNVIVRSGATYSTIADAIRIVEVDASFAQPDVQVFGALDSVLLDFNTNYQPIIAGEFDGNGGFEFTEYGLRGVSGNTLALDKYRSVDDDLSISVELSKIKSYDFVGLLVRGDELGNGYLVQAQTTDNYLDRIYLMRLDQGTPTSLGYVERELEEGERFGIQVEGDSFQVTVNDVPVGPVFVDTTYSSGQTGVAYHWENVGGTSFTDVVVAGSNLASIRLDGFSDFISNYETVVVGEFDGTGFEYTDNGVRGLVGQTLALDKNRLFADNLSMSVELVEINEWDLVGLVLRGDIYGNGYLVQAQTVDNELDRIYLFRLNNGITTSIGYFAHELQSGDRFGVQVEGSVFQITVNDIPVGSPFTDTTYSTGRTGISYLRGNFGGTSFDNLYIRNQELTGAQFSGYADFALDFETIAVGNFNDTGFEPTDRGIRGRSGQTFALEKFRTFADDLSISVELTAIYNVDYAGLIVRADAKGNGYLVQAKTIDNTVDEIHLKRLDNGSVNSIGYVKHELKVGDRFGVKVQGDAFQLTVNENPTGPIFYDDAYPTGRIGIAYERGNIGGTSIDRLAVSNTRLRHNKLNLIQQPNEFSGEILVNGNLLPLTDVNSTFTADVTLNDGTNNLTARFTDSAGNFAESDVSISVDTVAPTITLDPLPETVSADQLFVTGSVPGAERVKINGRLATIDSEGNFSGPLFVTEGNNTISVIAWDAAGNMAQQTVTFTLDRTPPVLAWIGEKAISAKPAYYVMWSVSDENNISDVVVTHQGEPIAIQSLSPPMAIATLVEGLNRITVRATDEYGNQSQIETTVLADFTSPTVSIKKEDVAIAHDATVVISDLNVQLALDVDGTGTELNSVNATLDGVDVSVPVDGGLMSFTLNSGAETLEIVATDAVGNSTSMRIHFSLDQQPPAVTWLSVIEPTNNPAYLARWTATDISGISLQQFTQNGQEKAFTALDDMHEASVNLIESVNTFNLSVTDTAGNVQTLQQTVLLDTTKPVITLLPLETLTASAVINVSGSVQDAVDVVLTVSGQNVAVNAQGQFASDITLVEGDNVITVQAVDALGNLEQQTVTVVRDQTGPVIQASLPLTVSNQVITLSGTAVDERTNVASITIENITTGVPFSANVTASQFTGELILQPGINQIRIVATDELNNSSSLQLQTELQADGFQWQWLSHSNNADVVDAAIVLEGLLETDIPQEDLSVLIGGQSATISEWATNTYSVKSTLLPLVLGDNIIELFVNSPSATLNSSIRLVRKDDKVTEPANEPTLTIHSPASDSQVNSEWVIVSGEVKADNRPTIHINGEAVTVATSVPYYRFNETIAVPQNQTEFDVVVTATFADNTQLTQTRTLHLDRTAPVISLANNLLAYPGVTAILEDPLRLSGTVSDPNFSSISLNGNVLTVSPVGQDTFAFTASVPLANGVETTLQFTAQDSAGNLSTLSHVVRGDRTIDVNWLLPLNNSQLLTYGDAFPLQVVVQASETTTSDRYQTRWQNNTTATTGDWQAMTFSNGTAVTEVTLPGTEGEYQLEFRVIDANDQRLASLPPRLFSVKAPAQVPLSLIKVLPEQGSLNIDTKEQISLFFNQSIDPALLDIRVHETAFGKTWINRDAKGTEFFNAKGHQLVDVQREHESVPLDIQLVGSNKTVLVNLGREPAYNATLFVDVTYNGESFARYQYQTRVLPTLINMVIRDQYSRDVPNLRVEFAGYSGITNGDGLVQFGYKDKGTPLADGNYTLWVNPDMENANYGETKLTVPAEAGRLNDFGIIPVSFLNPEIGATVLSSGANHSLNGDELLLDLTHAQVTFANGATQGNAHVQFNTAGYNYPTHALAEPSWLYSVQPLGIRLTGTATIKLKLPKHQNSWEYLPANGTLMLAVAVNPDNEMIEPIGLAERQGNYAVFLNPESVTVLDHLGVIFLPEAFQPTLEAFHNNEFSFPVMMAKLAEMARQYEPEQMEVTQ